MDTHREMTSEHGGQSSEKFGERPYPRMLIEEESTVGYAS
jgi:hypothetical protein